MEDPKTFGNTTYGAASIEEVGAPPPFSESVVGLASRGYTIPANGERAFPMFAKADEDPRVTADRIHISIEDVYAMTQKELDVVGGSRFSALKFFYANKRLYNTEEFAVVGGVLEEDVRESRTAGELRRRVNIFADAARRNPEFEALVEPLETGVFSPDYSPVLINSAAVQVLSERGVLTGRRMAHTRILKDSIETVLLEDGYGQPVHKRAWLCLRRYMDLSKPDLGLGCHGCRGWRAFRVPGVGAPSEVPILSANMTCQAGSEKGEIDYVFSLQGLVVKASYRNPRAGSHADILERFQRGGLVASVPGDLVWRFAREMHETATRSHPASEPAPQSPAARSPAARSPAARSPAARSPAARSPAAANLRQRTADMLDRYADLVSGPEKRREIEARSAARDLRRMDDFTASTFPPKDAPSTVRSAFVLDLVRELDANPTKTPKAILDAEASKARTEDVVNTADEILRAVPLLPRYVAENLVKSGYRSISDIESLGNSALSETNRMLVKLRHTIFSMPEEAEVEAWRNFRETMVPEFEQMWFWRSAGETPRIGAYLAIDTPEEGEAAVERIKDLLCAPCFRTTLYTNPRTHGLAGTVYIIAAAPRADLPIRIVEITVAVAPKYPVAEAMWECFFLKPAFQVRVAELKIAGLMEIRPDGVFRAGVPFVVQPENSIAALAAACGFNPDPEAIVGCTVAPSLSVLPAITRTTNCTGVFADMFTAGAGRPGDAEVTEFETRLNHVSRRMFLKTLDYVRDAASGISYTETTNYIFDGRAPNASLRVVERNLPPGPRELWQKLTVFSFEDAAVRYSVAHEKRIAENLVPPPSQAKRIRVLKRWSARVQGVSIDLTLASAYAVTQYPNRRHLYDATEIELEVNTPDLLPAMSEILNTVRLVALETPYAYPPQLKDAVIERFAAMLGANPNSVYDPKSVISVYPSAVTLKEYAPGLAVFTGSALMRPRNLKRRDLTVEGIGGEGVSGKMVVTAKANGETAFLIDDAESLWLFRPPATLSRIHVKTRPWWVWGWVLAVEVLEHKPGLAVRVVPFDVISSQAGKVDGTYTERFAMVSRAMRDIRSQLTEIDGLSHADEAFVWIQKPAALIEEPTPDSAADAFRRAGATETGDVDLPFETDGFILTPENGNQLYSGKPPPRRSLEEFRDVCKVKPWRELTIDMRVVSGRGERDRVLVGSSRGEVDFAPRGAGDLSKLVDWTSTFFRDAMPAGARIPWGTIIEFGPAVLMPDGTVFENASGFDPPRELSAPNARVILTPRRLRLDKEYPNAEATAYDVWNDITNFMSFKTVAGSANFAGLFAHSNRIKNQLIEQHIREYSNTLVLDIGSGKGGDLAKYAARLPHLRGAIFVEPNAANAEEFRRRSAGFEKFSEWGELIETIGEDTGAICAAVERRFAEARSAGKEITNFVIFSMLSMSFFWKNAETLREFKRTLHAAGGVAKRYGVERPRFVCYTVTGAGMRKLREELGDDARLGPVHIRFDDEKIWIDIPGSIVRDQTEYYVERKDLFPHIREFMAGPFAAPGERLYLTDAEIRFGQMFEYAACIIEAVDPESDGDVEEYEEPSVHVAPAAFPFITPTLPSAKAMFRDLGILMTPEVGSGRAGRPRIVGTALTMKPEGGLPVLHLKRTEEDYARVDYIAMHYVERVLTEAHHGGSLMDVWTRSVAPTTKDATLTKRRAELARFSGALVGRVMPTPPTFLASLLKIRSTPTAVLDLSGSCSNLIGAIAGDATGYLGVSSVEMDGAKAAVAELSKGDRFRIVDKLPKPSEFKFGLVILPAFRDLETARPFMSAEARFVLRDGHAEEIPGAKLNGKFVLETPYWTATFTTWNLVAETLPLPPIIADSDEQPVVRTRPVGDSATSRRITRIKDDGTMTVTIKPKAKRATRPRTGV